LGEIIGKILKNLGISRYKGEKKNLNILLISHYSVAEYTTLKNREELNSKLSEVQKTFCSFKPFIQKIR
jgi:hypothetical protein